MDAAEWDARYAQHDLVWGAGPNRSVAAELAELAPGRALDVACGEGRNAIWLASRGWPAVGVDFSTTGLQRARRLATEAGVADRTEFVHGDVVSGPLPDGPFDAIVVAYLQVSADQRRKALQLAVEELAPGGTLLVVAHDSTNLAEGYGGPQDPAVLYTPSDVVADLRGLPGLGVEKNERVLRQVQSPEEERTAIDALVRVHRAPDGPAA